MDDLPTATMIDPVSLIDLAKGGILLDVTEDATPLIPELVEGAFNDATLDGEDLWLSRFRASPALFYNQRIFDEYGVDPAPDGDHRGMDRGWTAAEGEERRSHLSLPTSIPPNHTWRYYGRPRDLCPRLGARIWDDQGNVVIGTDEGAKRAFTTLDTLCRRILLFKSTHFGTPDV